LRFVASPSLNGGRVIRWMLEYTVDDDDTAVRTTRWIGFLSGAVLFTLGVALLLRDGEASFWGVGLAATGIDVCALAAVGTRQTLWLQTANERTVGALLESQHAVVSASSSLDEMIAVLTVDGPRAVALVRDDAGLPVGIMQFQQMRSAIGRKGAHVTIGDVMIPLAELPLVERETSILDATHLLLERGSPAVRYLGADGKMHIATAADLGVPRGTT
ncbi:MAG: hypothetical protein KC438_15995, partial [Thermomicrobiales bacterium]|nr:hypothetical protein [Thermomicrobiales bacterium]